MGFNTVAFVLNDFAYSLEESPKSTSYLLNHAPFRSPDMMKHLRTLSKHCDERELHPQALEIVTTFHSDQTKVIAFGGNCYTEMYHGPGHNHHTKEGQLALLKIMANELGYCVRMKPKKIIK